MRHWKNRNVQKMVTRIFEKENNFFCQSVWNWFLHSKLAANKIFISEEAAFDVFCGEGKIFLLFSLLAFIWECHKGNKVAKFQTVEILVRKILALCLFLIDIFFLFCFWTIWSFDWNMKSVILLANIYSFYEIHMYWIIYVLTSM